MKANRHFLAGRVQEGDIVLLDMNIDGEEPEMPIGIGCVAAQLKRHRLPYQLYDQSLYKLTIPALLNELAKLRPKLVGFSCYCWTVGPSVLLVRALREILPDCLIVFGGPFVSGDPDIVLEVCPGVDVIVRGDGEYAILDLVAASCMEDLFHISGLSFRIEVGGQIFHTPDRPLEMNLDNYASPFLEGIFDIPRYRRVTTFRSRGCFQSCKFCAWGTRTGGGVYRENTLARFVEELIVVHREGGRLLIPSDGTFNYPKEFIFALHDEIIKNNLRFTWHDVDMRADLATRESLQALKQIGVVQVGFGYESVNKESQILIGKHLDLDRLKEALRYSRQLGLKSHCGYIIGIPGETEEDVRRSAAFAKQLDVDEIGVFPLELLPGTEFYNNYRRYGIYRFKNKEDLRYKCGTNLLSYDKIMQLVDELKREVTEFNLASYRRVTSAKRSKMLQNM